ncbi:hypothetical protein GWN91_00610, partial [Candidatus Saccharibacteria bacterium]|nr:hypothetical protein [Candidatus Saccharibacteria bacterium]NIW77955.1 hypothetical protein [Calditrichia bacterium]
IHPEDSAVLKEKLMDLDGKLTFLKHDFRFVKKSRETVYCSGAFVSIRYNNRPAILCELKDITRQRTLEEQLPQAQKMATMDMLATGIAHDFNNVMGGIIPSAQLIIRNPKSPETVKHARTIFR